MAVKSCQDVNRMFYDVPIILQTYQSRRNTTIFMRWFIFDNNLGDCSRIYTKLWTKYSPELYKTNIYSKKM